MTLHTRLELQRIATHVLARARHAATGRFGLRATPGGFGTPAFGDDVEVLRVAGTQLLRERAGRVECVAIGGSTLDGLATFAGADLDTEFSAGHDTPPLGPRDEPIAIDAGEAEVLASWWHLGWEAMDLVVATAASPMAIQLWPEHFDAGTSVAVGDGENDRANVGASPGDGFSASPYLYVSPWDDRRPGAASFWNAPFGASVTRAEILGSGDAVAAAVAFFRRGVALLSEDRSA